MRRVFAPILRYPLAFVGGAFVLLWVFYVGAVLRPRFGLPPLDTSRTVLLSRGMTTNLAQTAPDGQAQSVEKNIGPVVPWKNGLVYWDQNKPCLVYVLPNQKPKVVWLHPSLPKMRVESLTPAPEGVYLNVDNQIGFSVLYVHLPDGTHRVMRHMEGIKSSETTTTYAFQAVQRKNTTSAVVEVHYATSHKTRSVSVGDSTYLSSWDYDPARDAVVWIENDSVCYNSPAHSWQKSFSSSYGVSINRTTGDVWLQAGGGFGSSGMLVLTASGVERGWRWKGNTFYMAGLWELSPEQEKLARALPDHK